MSGAKGSAKGSYLRFFVHYLFISLALAVVGCQASEDLGLTKTSSAKTANPVHATSSAPATPTRARVCDPTCASIERCDAGQCVPDCPDGEIYVPATGPAGFSIGNGEPGEYNQKHTVVLSQPFCMDETELTVGAYRKCFDAGKCSKTEWRDINANFELPNREDHPLNMVTWDQALAYCQQRNQDLPTEAQFEWAAGHGKHRYPWGNEDPTCQNGLADFTPGGAPKSDPAGDVGCHGGNTSPVKAHPKGKTTWPDGDIYDLAGNVWEWTKDCAYAYGAEKQIDPHRTTHPSLGDHCFVYSLRGGGWNRSKFALRVYYRGAARRTYHVPGLGFRCIRNPT
jgi:formylglycine-generating enzyme required for sulfatase activity